MLLFATCGAAAALAQGVEPPYPAFPPADPKTEVRPSPQSVWTPVFTAPMVKGPGPDGTGDRSRSPVRLYGQPTDVLQVFEQGCLAAAGTTSTVVDWALSQGFEPSDVRQSASDESLLSGRAGAVLVAPGSEGRVLLVAADDGRCSVWADQMAGPPLRLAMRGWLEGLAGRGATIEAQGDRNLQRAGAWRNQLQWRYRATGSSAELALGAITTLAASPGTQLLHLQPLPVSSALPPVSPGGLPPR